MKSPAELKAMKKKYAKMKRDAEKEATKKMERNAAFMAIFGVLDPLGLTR